MFVLKTAREAKLNVSPKTISRMMRYFSGQYVDGRTEYYVIGNNLQIPPGVIYEGSPDDKPSTLAMTAVGMLAVEFFEHKLDSPVVQAGAATLADQAKATVDKRGAPHHRRPGRGARG